MPLPASANINDLIFREAGVPSWRLPVEVSATLLRSLLKEGLIWTWELWESNVPVITVVTQSYQQVMLWSDILLSCSIGTHTHTHTQEAGESAIHVATVKGHVSVVRVLAYYGADLNMPNKVWILRFIVISHVRSVHQNNHCNYSTCWPHWWWPLIKVTKA